MAHPAAAGDVAGCVDVDVGLVGRMGRVAGALCEGREVPDMHLPKASFNSEKTWEGGKRYVI